MVLELIAQNQLLSFFRRHDGRGALILAAPLFALGRLRGGLRRAHRALRFALAGARGTRPARRAPRTLVLALAGARGARAGPRAATSVAASTCSSQSLNRLMAFVRCGWLLLPWIALASMPSCSSCSARRFAACLVRVNTSTCCQLFACTRCASSWRFLSLST